MEKECGTCTGNRRGEIVRNQPPRVLDGVKRWVVNLQITGETILKGNIDRSPYCSDVREEEGLVEKHLWEQGDSDNTENKD